MDVVINRYIPFSYDVKRGDSNSEDTVLDSYIVDNFDIKHSSSAWFNMDLVKKQFRLEGIDPRTFPLLVKATAPISGTKILVDSETKKRVPINYLATIVFGIVNASREIINPENRQQTSEYISGISNYISSIIQMDREMLDETYALSGMIESAHFMLEELAPTNYKNYETQLERVEIKDKDGTIIDFKLLRDTDISMEQTIYIYDSKIGFIVNQISIKNMDEINQDTIYSMDLLYRLCAGGLEFDTSEEILNEINKKIPSMNIRGISFHDETFDVINYKEEVETNGLEQVSLIDNPLVEVFDTELKSNLFLLKIKTAQSLKSQADFRTALQNKGMYRQKVDITTSMGFIFLQLFHEETQTRKYLDIYSESWTSWYNDLAKALNYSTAQILAGATRSLNDIYYESNKLELFFVQQFNDMSLTAKIDELAETVRYHLFMINLSGGSISILPDDMDKSSSAILLSKLETLNQQSSYIEFIDPKLFFKVLANRLNLENNYNSFRELHKNLEEILASVQEISQTKQQRIITIAIVIFSITELILAFLEVFSNYFGI